MRTAKRIVLVSFGFPAVQLAAAQAQPVDEIRRAYKQLIDAESWHDIPAIRAMIVRAG
jgi:hypothetical protein